MSSVRGRSVIFIQGYQKGYDNACQHMAADAEHSLWDHRKLEEAIYETSSELGAMKFEHDKARGKARDLNLNDSLFLTIGARDALAKGANRTDDEKASDSFQAGIYRAKVEELESKLAQLLHQKDCMRRHSKQRNMPRLRSSCRLAPRSSEIGLHSEAMEAWNPVESEMWSPKGHRWAETEGSKPLEPTRVTPALVERGLGIETYLGNTLDPIGSGTLKPESRGPPLSARTRTEEPPVTTSFSRHQSNLYHSSIGSPLDRVTLLGPSRLDSRLDLEGTAILPTPLDRVTLMEGQPLSRFSMSFSQPIAKTHDTWYLQGYHL